MPSAPRSYASTRSRYARSSRSRSSSTVELLTVHSGASPDRHADPLVQGERPGVGMSPQCTVALAVLVEGSERPAQQHPRDTPVALIPRDRDPLDVSLAQLRIVQG